MKGVVQRFCLRLKLTHYWFFKSGIKYIRNDETDYYSCFGGVARALRFY